MQRSGYSRWPTTVQRSNSLWLQEVRNLTRPLQRLIRTEQAYVQRIEQLLRDHRYHRDRVSN